MASVDQNGRRIICLANSRKPDGRCIAGKLYFQGKFGKWLRPISALEAPTTIALVREGGAWKVSMLHSIPLT